MKCPKCGSRELYAYCYGSMTFVQGAYDYPDQYEWEMYEYDTTGGINVLCNLCKHEWEVDRLYEESLCGP